MPSPPINLEQAVAWTGGSAAVATIGTMVIRFLMKSFRADKLEALATDADSGSYVRLQREIARLENIIIVQQQRTDELEARLDALRDIELDDIADIATLMVLIQNNCGKCANATDVHQQMIDIVRSLKERKLGVVAMTKMDHLPAAQTIAPPKKESATKTKGKE